MATFPLSSRLLTLAGLLAALCILPGASACTELKRRAYAGGDRDAWQQPEAVVQALEIQPGDRVADLGSGGGYFTFRLADAVGPTGRVYAVDVDADMNAALEEDIRERGVENVQVILAEFDDPKLPEASVDLIFTCNTYHHIQDRSTYFANAARALGEGGRIAVVEYRRQGLFQRWLGHATPAEEIRSELEAAGYRLEKQHDFLERQHFMVFAR